MVIEAGILNLTSIRAASNAKKEIDTSLILAFVGLIILLFGIGILKINTEMYWSSWLTTSGFIVIIYSLIKLITSMVD